MIGLQPLLPWPVVAAGAGGLVAVLVFVAVRWPHGSPAQWLARAAIVVLLALAALGPHLGDDRVSYATRPPVQVVVALDRTASMAVDDTPVESRVDQAVGDLIGLIEQLSDPVALVTWGRQARMTVPTTTDTTFLTRALTNIETELPVAGVGSRIDRPLRLLQHHLRNSKEADPDTEIYLLVLSDGENTSGGRPRSYAPLTPWLSGGAVIGYGSAKGGPIPLGDGAGLVPAPGGAGPAISRRDEESLAAVARQLDVGLWLREELDSVAVVAPSLDPGERVVAGPSRARDVTWVVALALLVLLAFELHRVLRGAREAWSVGRSR